jgi:hypothetical protein
MQRFYRAGAPDSSAAVAIILWRGLLAQEFKDFDLEYAIVRNAQRIVHDNSPVWVNRDLVRCWFPALKFQKTDFGYQNVQRTVERRIIKLSQNGIGQSKVSEI